MGVELKFDSHIRVTGIISPAKTICWTNFECPEARTGRNASDRDAVDTYEGFANTSMANTDRQENARIQHIHASYTSNIRGARV